MAYNTSSSGGLKQLMTLGLTSQTINAGNSSTAQVITITPTGSRLLVSVFQTGFLTAGAGVGGAVLIAAPPPANQSVTYPSGILASGVGATTTAPMHVSYWMTGLTPGVQITVIWQFSVTGSSGSYTVVSSSGNLMSVADYG